MERELWRWDAVEVAAAIRVRKISSREAVTSVLGRLDHVNPALNAVTGLLADQALAAADVHRRIRHDKRRADGRGAARPAAPGGGEPPRAPHADRPRALTP